MTNETPLKPGDLVELVGEPTWMLKTRDAIDRAIGVFKECSPRQVTHAYGDGDVYVEGAGVLSPSCLRRVLPALPAVAVPGDREALCALLAYVHEEHEENVDPKEILQRAMNGWPTMFTAEQKPIRKAVDSALPAGDAKPEPVKTYADGFRDGAEAMRREAVTVCKLLQADRNTNREDAHEKDDHFRAHAAFERMNECAKLANDIKSLPLPEVPRG